MFVRAAGVRRVSIRHEEGGVAAKIYSTTILTGFIYNADEGKKER